VCDQLLNILIDKKICFAKIYVLFYLFGLTQPGP